MKKLVGITGCFLMLCNIIMYVILPSMPQSAAVPAEEISEVSEYDTSTPDDEEIEDSDTEDMAEMYILRSYNGLLAVFKGDSDVPYIETDVRIADLPYADMELLNTGIAVESYSELNRLLEDYCS